ncbi:MAG: LysM peptidoglycan-binding domain-containing protein [Bacteroidia bacterium]|nr:LysM peptidoglycan-binding domain-containing protein [Bacteroidia bacterium]
MIEKINGKDYYIHEVKKGESLYGLSKLYNVSPEVILNENLSVKEKGLKTGQKIIIPCKQENFSCENKDTLKYRYHQVLKQQTIYSICKEYNITQEQFFEWNPGKKTGIKENEWVIVGKKEKVIEKKENIVPKIKNEIAEKTNVFFTSFPKKKDYDVMMLLPFGADKAEDMVVEDLIKSEQGFPNMSSMMIDFYMGMTFAADSLKTDSFHVHLLPIDIKETDSLKLIQVLNTNEYKNSDVIVGPVFSSLIKTEQQLSSSTKFHVIPFISQNKFLFNHPEYSKTTPSIYIDIQMLANYVFDSLRKKTTVLLLYGNSNNDKEYAKEFKRYYNDLIYKNNYKDTIKTFKNIADLKNHIKEKEEYTVVLLASNQVIATDYITQLSIINKTSPIHLCSFFKTITYDNLDLEYLNQMNFVFSYYQNINYHNVFNNYVRRYKEYFQTEPSTFFYEGMQIGLYYFNLIKNYGLGALYNLSNLPYSNDKSFMRFKFYRPDETTGFQNNGEYIFKITDRKIFQIR